MAKHPHRYRITVTPIAGDGMPCHGRCTIEFEHASHEDWIPVLEAMQRQRGLTGDERAALVVGSKLISGLILAHRKDADDVFAALRPHMADFIAGMKQRNRAA